MPVEANRHAGSGWRQSSEAQYAREVSLAALSWQPGSPDGLATFEAFRADPTLVDGRGEMIGLAALPAMLAAQPSFAYPSHATRSYALLPALEEMGEIFRRAWAVDEMAATIH
jgi:hypothetical protein